MNKNIEHAIRANSIEASLQEKFDELMKIEGKMRGELLLSNFNYLKQREGEEGVLRMEKNLENLGYPLKFNEIKAFDWYEDPFCSLFMLSFFEIFEWKEEDIFELGKFAPSYSIAMKVVLRYLISMKMAFNRTQDIWRRNVDYGALEPLEINEKEKYMILGLKDYALHPLVCIYIKGILTSFFEQIAGRDKVKVEEAKCVFNGADYHEYKVSWE